MALPVEQGLFPTAAAFLSLAAVRSRRAADGSNEKEERRADREDADVSRPGGAMSNPDIDAEQDSCVVDCEDDRPRLRSAVVDEDEDGDGAAVALNCVSMGAVFLFPSPGRADE